MKNILRDWARAVTAIRREEILPTVLMFLYGWLALTSYYVIKPVRNSVFVDRVGADNLPLIYVLAALVIIGLMLVYSRYVDRIDRRTLLLGTFAVLAVTLVGFWWWLGRAGGTVVASGAFYIYTKLYPLLLVSQFWLVGNLLFTTRQAKRLFAPIDVGLILGGITGSIVSSTLADSLGNELLLLLAAGILGGCAVLVLLLFPHMRRGEERAGSALAENVSGDAVRLLMQSSHLRTIAWILGLTIVVGTVLDWQLNRAVELQITGEEAMTRFWGTFYAVLNVGSVSIQLLLTAFILRKFGIGVALLALPVALLVASVGVLVLPGLLAAAIAKGTEGGLRYSLDQSTRELLYLPVPTHVKYKVKPLIDLAVYRGGTGVGGLALLFFVNLLGFSLRWISVVALAFIGLWVWHALRMREEFRTSIKRLIGVRDVRLEELIYRHLDAATIDELRNVLRTGDPDQIAYALALLEHGHAEAMDSELRDLLHHASETVRRRAVALLVDLGLGELVDDVRPLLEDPSRAVRAEAVRYVCSFGPMESAEQMHDFLESTNQGVRTAAISCLFTHGDAEARAQGLAAIREFANSDDATARQTAAELLGEMGDPAEEGRELLEDLIRDDAPAVCHEAMRAAGRLGALDLLPHLVERLAEPAAQKAAREALGQFGLDAHDSLLGYLADDDTPLVVLVELPSLLHGDADQATVDRLAEIVPQLPRPARYEAVKTLGKLRRDRDDLRFDRFDLTPLVRAEVEDGYRWAALAVDADDDPEPDSRHSLLVRTLEQRRVEAAERALRLLGLQHDLENLYAGFTALTSRSDIMRHRGFELLDATLPRPYREWLDPLLNPEEEAPTRARAAERRFGAERRGRDRVVEELCASDDYWVAVIARREAGRPPPSAPGADEPGARLRADTLLRKAGLPSQEHPDIMTIIERADFLRRTEVFENLRTEDLAGAAALMREMEFAADEMIFEEGARGRTLYVVTEGKVEARKDGRLLFVAEPGETIGNLSLLDGLPTDYEALAVARTRTLVLDREGFERLLEERDSVVKGVVTYLSGIIRRLNEHPERLRRDDVDE